MKEIIITDEIKHTQGTTVDKFMTVLMLCFVCIVLLCSFFPRDWNWGADVLAFFPLSLRVLWLVLSLLCIIPFTRNIGYRAFQKILLFIKEHLGKSSVVLFGCLFIVFFWLFPVQTFLLGDGANHLRSLSAMKIQEGIEIDLSFAAFDPTDFSNEPFAGVVNWALFNVLRTQETGDAHLIFRVTGLIAFLIFYFALIFFFHRFSSSAEEKILLFGIIFFNASSLFFFGYVEYYALFYTAMLTYLCSGWMVLEQRMNSIFTGVIFGLMLGFHFASIIFIPSFMLLLFFAYPQQKKSVIISAMCAVLVFIAGCVCIGYGYEQFLTQFSEGEGKHFLPLVFNTSYYFSYAIFSFAHFIDIINLVLLVAPIVFIIISGIVWYYRKYFQWRNRIFLFLSASMCCGLLFIFIVNFELGMSRDWDVASVFLLPAIVLSVYLLHEYIAEHRAIVFGLCGFLCIQFSFWVALNHSEEKGLQRYLSFEGTSVAGVRVQTLYFDELASYYRTQKNYFKIAESLEKYIAIQPPHKRILESLSEAYQMTGQTEKHIRILERSILLDSSDANTWANLGLCYFLLKKFDEGEKYSKKALSLDNNNVTALYNLGMNSLMDKTTCEQAAMYFGRILENNIKHTEALQGITYALSCLGDYESAEFFCKEYLLILPDDKEMREYSTLLKKMKVE